MVNALIETTGRSLALLDGNAALAEPIADIAPALAIANQCRRQLDQIQIELRELSWWSIGKDVGRARRVHQLLPYVADVDAARRALSDVLHPCEPITYRQAVEMLNALVGTMSRKRADDTETMLANCANLFSPQSDVVAKTTRLWRPVNRHPAVLALAIERLFHLTTFMPAPRELLASMETVQQTLAGLLRNVERWLELINRADEIMFAVDPRRWKANYEELGSAVVTAMLCKPDESTPRYDALDRMWENKREHEEASK
jgi:hypothetical protein